ncbi:MAG TPA: DUF4231 domain-containing protein [Pyrinomonadaceae bacterium]|nr:DUF4231 domain-containing protein [Pyrinomonadaceae bacterium]
MQAEEYLQQRLEEQIDWYDRKSRAAQHRYKLLRVLEICLAASIPVISGFAEFVPVWSVHPTLLVALAGVMLTIVAGLLSLYRYQEVWVNYRTVCDSLRREKFLFLTRTAPYDTAAPLSLLVERAESLMSQENSSWTTYIRTAASSGPEPAAATAGGEDKN